MIVEVIFCVCRIVYIFVTVIECVIVCIVCYFCVIVSVSVIVYVL